jgi:hemoglobin/transferrin/lactoferrin receptor protein
VIYRSEYNINSRNRSPSTGAARYDQTFFTTNGTDTYNTASINTFGLKHKITTGIEYFENEQSGTRNGVPRSSIGQGADKNLGLYGQEEVTLFDKLTLSPAIRFDQYNLDPANPSKAAQSRQQWSPKIGADYQLNNVWSFYGSVGKAFRTPTLVELYSEDTTGASGVFITPNPNLSPETALNKELGVRFDKPSVLATNDRLNFKFSAFNNKIDDYIEQVVTSGGFGPPTATYRNTPQAELNGLELEAGYKIGKYGAKLNAGGVRGDNQKAGQPLVDVPADRYSASIERYNYDYQLTTGVRTTYMAAQNRIPSGQLDIVTTPSATTFDVYASYTPNEPRLQGMRLDMGVDNVFDKHYRRQLAFIPEAGRNIKATMSWKF